MAYPNGLPRWCTYWCTPRKYRPKQITVKELKNKMRSRKEKKLSQIIIPKNCEFQQIKANFFGRKFCDFCFVEHPVFSNVGFLSTLKGFSANISKF